MTTRSLDGRTIERLAKVIIDYEGPYERRGHELESLLRRSAWEDPPEYDGTPRVPWLVEQLTERNGTADVEHLLCRICDPIEYDAGAEVAQVFHALVNGILEPEQLVISYVGHRPVLAQLSGDGTHPVFTEPEEMERRLRSIIADDATVTGLLRRLGETRICEANGAYTFAIIGIGSLVEGILHAVLTERDQEFRNREILVGGRDRRRRVEPERASMEFLIDRAKALGFIQLDATKFMHNVRDFRNFVHPRKELAEQPGFDRDSVMLCWGPVRALLNDLEEKLSATAPAVAG
ncbi:hypothetical protein ACIBL3_14480 [Kribbella sp. NPDC050124]|uniref:hypothetical protein n=1 Tax=Kribbella sp. NPDC050124 TaxID=3364114 RepID=UPI00379A24CC